MIKAKVIPNSKKMSIPIKDQKILWGRSAGMCNLTKVQLILQNSSGEVFYNGENAHIKGEHAGAARYDAGMTDEARNTYSNLILLCSNCHTIIDKDVITYTVEKLNETKIYHERWVNQQIIGSLTHVTFAELENIIKYLIKTYNFEQGDLYLLAPKSKIEKNKLPAKVEELIRMGLVKTALVKKYLNLHPDIDFADRLKRGFVDKYSELVAEGKDAEEIFYTLFDFSSNNSCDFLQKAAGLSVLVYFFEQCDIFEK